MSPPAFARASLPACRVKEFSDVVFEFVLVDGKVQELKQIDPSGEQRFPRK